eukprot:TRINITY_DN23173_c0_g1_i1.p1 TRINITY_DN23173_c0_g1~~TRINITY_DN23173_c0_g1_i1.p1  ORF type:complete len:351 (+),score=41.49 TRINITY_DN23173_c0_g1_i1:67-1119(+)
MPPIPDADLLLDGFHCDIVAEFKVLNFKQVAERSQYGDFLEVSVFKFQGFEFDLKLYPRGGIGRETKDSAVVSLIRTDDEPEDCSGWFHVEALDGQRTIMEPDEDSLDRSVWAPQIQQEIYVNLGSWYTLMKRCTDALGSLKLCFRFLPELAGARSPCYPASSQANRCTADIGNLLETRAFSDVTLLAGGDELKAHRSIISARSLVFQRMFANDMSETSHGNVHILDFDASTMSDFLQFLYTGSVARVGASRFTSHDGAHGGVEGTWEVDELTLHLRGPFSITSSDSTLNLKGAVVDDLTDHTNSVRMISGDMQLQVPGTWRVDLQGNEFIILKLGKYGHKLFMKKTNCI